MKKQLIYYAVCMLCATSLYACAKTVSNTQSTTVSVLWDKTDTLLSNPDVSKIVGLYDLTTNRWNGGYFSYASITDVDFNQRLSTQLIPDNLWSGNELKRKKQVQLFFQTVDSILHQSETIKAGRLHSSIYRSVINEMVRLQSEPSNSHLLLLYSDLQENSDLFNIYDKSSLHQLMSKPELIKAMFEKAMPIPDLKGITIYILFQPKSQEDNRIFNSMSGLYRDLLVKHGAIVLIQANL